MSKEVLDLSTIVDRDTVLIRSTVHPDGKAYPIRKEQELSIWETSVLGVQTQALADIDVKKKPTPEQERRHRRALKEITEILVIGLEPEVLKQLGDVQMLAILGVFRGATPPGDEPGEAESGQTSAASSRASSGSTAATRRRGSARRAGS